MAVTDDLRDLVRLKIGDTGSTQLLTDDQIDLLIGETTIANLAAADCADALAARFSKSATFAVEGLRIENSVKAENYLKLAERLRSTSTTIDYAAGAAVTGVSKGDMETVDLDADRTDSRFKIGMHEHPGSSNSPETEF